MKICDRCRKTQAQVWESSDSGIQTYWVGLLSMLPWDSVRSREAWGEAMMEMELCSDCRWEISQLIESAIRGSIMEYGETEGHQREIDITPEQLPGMPR